MPAPAVYVIAIVGTVGAAIAFNEFIYVPHIAPRIDRWMAEFQAARNRRAEVTLIQRGVDRDGHQNPEDDDNDSDHSDVDLGKGAPAPRPYMNNGLLIRRNNRSEATLSKPGDIELDNLITGASTATETGFQQSDLRSRKNNGPLNEPITIQFDLKKTTSNATGTHAVLDESIQAIPYTPLTPIRTPTPTHVLYNSSSTHSPSDSPFSATDCLPLPEEVLLPKLKTSVTDSSTSYPLVAPLQPSSPSCTGDTASASASKAKSFPRSPRSPPGLDNIVSSASKMAVAGVAPLLPANVDSATIPTKPFPPLLPLSSPTALSPSSPPSQLLSPTGSRASPYQTPPQVHAIPSLSQSYPLDDLLEYEHGLELLSPPSPLSRTDSPFEFAGLSPRPEMAEGSTLLLASRGMSGEQLSAAPMDGMTNSTRSTTYLSFHSSPALSASSAFASSENGYENDSSQSNFSSTFSSPIVPLSFGLDLGSESLPHRDQAHSMSPLLSTSSPSLNPQLRRPQQQEVGQMSTRPSVPVFPTRTTRSQQSNARRPIEDDEEEDDHAGTQTLSPRNRTRSPWTTVNRSVATTPISAEVNPIQPATPMSKVTLSNSDFDTESELSDLDFLNMAAEEYKAAAPAQAAAVGRGYNSVGRSKGSGSGLRRAGGTGKPAMGDGNESDNSSWSFAGGSE